MERIPDLPAAFPDGVGGTLDLRQVPAAASRPTDPEAEVKAVQWRLWADAVQLYRLQTMQRTADDVQQQALEYARCAADPAYFLSVYGWIFEPRAGANEGDKPFRLYPFQVGALRWLDTVMAGTGAKADGIASKSRDMGMTWLCCAYVLHGFLFKEPFIAKLISRREDLVDDRNNPDSMFWKIIYLLDNLPPWLLPEGFNFADHRSKLKLTHPTKRCAIVGESTSSKSGRGGRSTLAIIDEAAFIDDLQSLYTSIAPTTNHRILVSSESLDHGDFFYRLRTAEDKHHATRPNVLELDWWLHPEHDRAWFLDQKSRYAEDLEGFGREVERNPHAGAGVWIYPVTRQYKVGDFPYEVGMPLYVGFDPGFDDEAALNWVAFDPRSGRYRVLESYANAGQPPEYYASLLTGVRESGPEGFDYAPHGLYDPDDILAFVRMLRGGISYFGDPNGKERRTGTTDSWYDRIYRWSRDHSPTGRGIIFEVGWSMDQRTFAGRRASLRSLLSRMDFNDTPGVRRLLRAMQEHRFERIDRPIQNERRTPHHHGDESHIIAALEYFAVNVERLDAQGGFDYRPVDDRGRRLDLGARRAA